MSAGAPVLEARGLVKALGATVKTTILHGLDLRIARGEFVALTGHSGSGKSTLLYLLGVLDKPTAGTVMLDGVDTSLLDDDARGALRNEKLGFVFQFHFLLPEFSAAENVMIPLLKRGVRPGDARAAAVDTLRALGLAELAERRPGQLSGGQQQRVSIARALANDPRVVLADEPTGNLDSENAEVVMKLLTRVNEERGVSVVMVTHELDFAARAGRRIGLKDGRIVSDSANPSIQE
ncbi:MAG: ABC transporter ATP-binding protein [Deltaproteobacteria bacterium]|nr:ABC transporter ATP-binding protein [Deltaproteobacteria bacterium]